MKIRIKLLAACICLIGALAGCQASVERGWVVTTAMIEPFSHPEVGAGYKISYEASESTAVNQEGEPIKGLIEQYVTGIQKPVKAQRIKIRYQIDEPVIFERLSEIETE